MGVFLSPQLVSAHSVEAEQSVYGLKICFAADDGNSSVREKRKPVGICSSLSPSLLACHSVYFYKKGSFCLNLFEKHQAGVREYPTLGFSQSSAQGLDKAL